MKTNKANATKISFEKIEAFLREHGWKETRSGKVARLYSPPADLGLSDTFTLAIPLPDRRSTSGDLVYSISNMLENVYARPFHELIRPVVEADEFESWYLKSRLEGEKIGRGTIGLAEFENYISQVSKSFFEIAKFNLGGDGPLQVAQADRFLKSCCFHPTEVGSFITNIEIKNNVLREHDLVSPELNSLDVASSWFSAIHFLNTNVLQGSSDEAYLEEAVSDSLEFLNLPTVTSLKRLIEDTEAKLFEFELMTHIGRKSSSTGVLSEVAIDRLESFEKIFQDRVTVESDVSIDGFVNTLKSRDPSGNRNYVDIQANIRNELVRVSMTLTNAQYQEAVQAHISGRKVLVSGEAIRLKTKLRMTSISSFVVR